MLQMSISLMWLISVCPISFLSHFISSETLFATLNAPDYYCSSSLSAVQPGHLFPSLSFQTPHNPTHNLFTLEGLHLILIYIIGNNIYLCLSFFALLLFFCSIWFFFSSDSWPILLFYSTAMANCWQWFKISVWKLGNYWTLSLSLRLCACVCVCVSDSLN